jgi:hypothetical protein
LASLIEKPFLTVAGDANAKTGDLAVKNEIISVLGGLEPLKEFLRELFWHHGLPVDSAGSV